MEEWNVPKLHKYSGSIVHSKFLGTFNLGSKD
jgi:hypothetical protein